MPMILVDFFTRLESIHIVHVANRNLSRSGSLALKRAYVRKLPRARAEHSSDLSDFAHAGDDHRFRP